jgi:PTS system nitrogen regulatory IIA component
MKIMDFLCPEAITVDLKAQDKKAAIAELTELLVKSKKVKKAPDVMETVMEREKLGSTGIGQGVAIPHGKTDAVPEQIGALGISQKGVEFNSLDGEPVYVIFMLVGPEEVAGQHLKALSRISRLFKDRFFRQALRDAKNVEEVVKIIEQEDPRKPLSDSKIVSILQREGLELARRTIAKYREELKIPTSNQRKVLY